MLKFEQVRLNLPNSILPIDAVGEQARGEVFVRGPLMAWLRRSDPGPSKTLVCLTHTHTHPRMNAQARYPSMVVMISMVEPT